MSDIDLFDKHFKSGFDLGWHREAPRFTPEDWREFIVLVYKLWSISTATEWPKYCSKVLSSISNEIWDAFPEMEMSAKNTVLVNLLSPLGGQLDFTRHVGVYDWYELNPHTNSNLTGRFSALDEILSQAIQSNRWSNTTRENFLSGLALAANDSHVGLFVSDFIEKWLSSLSKLDVLPHSLKPMLAICGQK